MFLCVTVSIFNLLLVEMKGTPKRLYTDYNAQLGKEKLLLDKQEEKQFL